MPTVSMTLTVQMGIPEDPEAVDPIGVERAVRAARNRAATPDAPLTRLSPRELEVLELLISGATNAEIALSLTISPAPQRDTPSR